MKSYLSTLILTVGLVTYAAGGYAQDSNAGGQFTPAQCDRMIKLRDTKLNGELIRAQDRYDKISSSARDALTFLAKTKKQAIEDRNDHVTLDAGYLATLSLNTLAQAVGDVLKLNPATCTATESATAITKAILESADNIQLYVDVVKPMVIQAREDPLRISDEAHEGALVTVAGMISACAIPAGAAAVAGYHLGKNVAEIGNELEDARQNVGIEDAAIKGLEHYVRQWGDRLKSSGLRLQTLTRIKEEIDEQCSNPPTPTASPSNLKNLVAMGDAADKQDRLDFRSALDRAKQCNTIGCVTDALEDAKKVARGSGDRKAVEAVYEKEGLRVQLALADEEIKKRNIARAQEAKQANQRAQQANQHTIANAVSSAPKTQIAGKASVGCGKRGEIFSDVPLDKLRTVCLEKNGSTWEGGRRGGASDATLCGRFTHDGHPLQEDQGVRNISACYCGQYHDARGGPYGDRLDAKQCWVFFDSFQPDGSRVAFGDSIRRDQME